jgi:phosphohistidine phosphatase
VKRLLLIRHAKSDWAEPALADHSRPLAGRGRKEAPRLGQAIRRMAWIPDQVLCSTARRAMETIQLVQEGWETRVPVRLASELYLAGIDELVTAVREASEELSDRSTGPLASDCLAVVGHNPGLSHWASQLVDRNLDLATADAIGVELGSLADWPELSTKTRGRMVLHIGPPNFGIGSDDRDS